MKVEEFKMKMYGIKNEMKNVVGFVCESMNLKVEIDKEVFDEVFESCWEMVRNETSMILEDGEFEGKVEMRFVKSEENEYDVYVNDEKYEFDY